MSLIEVPLETLMTDFVCGASSKTPGERCRELPEYILDKEQLTHCHEHMNRPGRLKCELDMHLWSSENRLVIEKFGYVQCKFCLQKFKSVEAFVPYKRIVDLYSSDGPVHDSSVDTSDPYGQKRYEGYLEEQRQIKERLGW